MYVARICENTLISCIGYVSVMDTCYIQLGLYPRTPSYRVLDMYLLWTRAATISTHGLSGKNKYMNIRYLGLDISAHLFLCWIWPSPVNRLVFEGNCYSLRSFPALDATATHVGAHCTTSLSLNSSSGDPRWPATVR